jgi:hypothetical protein
MSNDPPEYIGRDTKQGKATPPVSSRRAAPVAHQPTVPLVEPVKSHPKIAHRAPLLAYEAAQIETVEARSELFAATNALRQSERAEGAALAEWCRLNPPPSADSVYRAHVAQSQERRAAAVARGDDPDAPQVPVVENNSSPLDTFARLRGKQGKHSPLRSNVVRR